MAIDFPNLNFGGVLVVSLQLRFLLSVSVCLSAASSILAQENWPRFHGPNGTGVALEANLPQSWSNEDYDWQIDLPGEGVGSPVVWQDRLFLTASDPQTAQLTVMGIAADSGKLLWRKQFESDKYRLHRKNSFASSTMAASHDGVFLTFASEKHTWLIALSHDGVEKWKRDFGDYVSSHGFGGSPLIYQDKVILFNSQQATRLKDGQSPGQSSVIAVRANDGSDLWHAQLSATRVCYGVPCVFQGADGVDQLIGANTGNGFYSIDPDSGEMNWQTGDSFSKRVVASPVLTNDLVLATAGSGGGGNYLVAIKLNADSRTPPTEAYRIRSASYVPSPVVVDDLLFMFGDKGIVSCHDVQTGNLFWKKRAAKAFSGSPVATRKNLYAIDEVGNIHVVAVDKQPKLKIVASMEQRSFSTPAIAGNQIFFRSHGRLWALGAKPK